MTISHNSLLFNSRCKLTFAGYRIGNTANGFCILPVMICKNCGNTFEGNFCNICGQSANTRRFHFFYFLKETFFSSLDIENGLFYTIKVLFIKPGLAIREYLDGKRISLYVPAKFLLLIGAMATFVSMRYDLFLSHELAPVAVIANLGDFLAFAQEYATIINVIAIPVFALFSWLFFRGEGYNYTENLILNIYITAQQLLMLLLVFPVVMIIPSAKEDIIAVYGVLTFIYNFWAYYSFYQGGTAIRVSKIALILICAYLGQFFLNYCFYQLVGSRLLAL